MLINRYATFVRDIESKGSDLIIMDGYWTRRNIQSVKQILEDPEGRNKRINTNYEIARRHYSFSMLCRWSAMLLTNFFGEDM